MQELKPCPCGKTPTNLCVIEGSSCKFAFVTGNCCGEWHVEFRTDYTDLDSDECYGLAVSAWNETVRAHGDAK